MSSIEDRVKKIVAEQLGIKQDEIKPRILLCRRSRRRLFGYCRACDGS